jgi:hypothetical protein
MVTSQNGWPASTNPDAIDCDWYRVPNTTINLRLAKDAAPLLIAAASHWHRRIEPLHEGWCWSYLYKFIEGTTIISNHASGTAIDLNAPKHPMGVPTRNTMSRRQVRRAKRIARRYGLVWGGVWASRPDAMHLEMAITPAEARRKARRLGLS